MPTETTPNICPHLGLLDDRTVIRLSPDLEHRCYAQNPLGEPGERHQRRYCFSAEHGQCQYYRALAKQPPARRAAVAPPVERGSWPIWRWAYVAILGVALVIVIAIYARSFFLPAQTPGTAPTAAVPVVAPDSTPTPVVAGATPPDAAPSPTRFVTPQPVAGGSVITISPNDGQVGWWVDTEPDNNHLGDSYLYAGLFDEQVFISAATIDLAGVPRGAEIGEAYITLFGLSDERLDSTVAAQWTVSLLPASAVGELARTEYQTLLNAPAAVTLAPALAAADLVAGDANIWQLDATALAWLEQQTLTSPAKITLRIVGPTSGASTLFAWDSGQGLSTAGAPPQLILSLGSAPETPPPLVTADVIVATLTPTPANVLTVAADAFTATAIASTIGTYTPAPPNIVTPTPVPANLATVQAIAVLNGLPPVFEHTPTPANAATATAYAAYATAVARTTGTFTPVPTNAVTPVLITATPTPANLATAVAAVLTATAQAANGITPTPWPYNALVPTPTWTPFVVTATPASEASAAFATAVALTTGTFTPLPPNATVLVPSANTPTPTVTPTATSAITIAAGTFAPGQIVITGQAANVRSLPGTASEIVAALDAGIQLEIIDGPQSADDLLWWQVRFTDAAGTEIDGWVAEPLLQALPES